MGFDDRDQDVRVDGVTLDGEAVADPLTAVQR